MTETFKNSTAAALIYVQQQQQWYVAIYVTVLKLWVDLGWANSIT